MSAWKRGLGGVMGENRRRGLFFSIRNRAGIIGVTKRRVACNEFWSSRKREILQNLYSNIEHMNHL